MPLWDGHFLIVGKCSEGKVRNVKKYFIHAPAWNGGSFQDLPGGAILRAAPHNSRLTAQAPLRRLRHGICVAKMLDNVGLRYPHRASGAKAPRTLRPLPLLRFAVSATGGAHLCSIQYYLRFWLGICRTSLAVSVLRIMRYCLNQCLRVKQAAECFCVGKMAEPKTVEKYSAGTAPCTPVFTE